MYGGGARRASLGISAQEAPLYPGPCSTAPSNVSITFKGPLSGCTPNNGKACSAQEAIEFTAVSPSYSFATCDKFAWNFGDGGAVTTLMNGTSHQFTPGKTRTVTLTVTNDFGTTRAASTLDIPLAGEREHSLFRQQPVSGHARRGRRASTIEQDRNRRSERSDARHRLLHFVRSHVQHSKS